MLNEKSEITGNGLNEIFHHGILTILRDQKRYSLPVPQAMREAIYPSYSAFAAIYCEKADLPALPAGRQAAGRRQGRLDGFTPSLIEGYILMQTSVKEGYKI